MGGEQKNVMGNSEMEEPGEERASGKKKGPTPNSVGRQALRITGRICHMSVIVSLTRADTVGSREGDQSEAG